MTHRDGLLELGKCMIARLRYELHCMSYVLCIYSIIHTSIPEPVIWLTTQVHSVCLSMYMPGGTLYILCPSLIPDDLHQVHHGHAGSPQQALVSKSNHIDEHAGIWRKRDLDQSGPGGEVEKWE